MKISSLCWSNIKAHEGYQSTWMTYLLSDILPHKHRKKQAMTTTLFSLHSYLGSGFSWQHGVFNQPIPTLLIRCNNWCLRHLAMVISVVSVQADGGCVIGQGSCSLTSVH